MSLKKKAAKMAARKVHPALPAAIWLSGKVYKHYKKKKREKNAEGN